MTPAEEVLMDAMLAHGWTPGQCRMAFAAAARGTMVAARSVTPDGDYNMGLTRQGMIKVNRDLLLQKLGLEAAKQAGVTYDTDGLGGMVLEARLLVVPCGLDGRIP